MTAYQEADVNDYAREPQNKASGAELASGWQRSRCSTSLWVSELARRPAGLEPSFQETRASWGDDGSKGLPGAVVPSCFPGSSVPQGAEEPPFTSTSLVQAEC